MAHQNIQTYSSRSGSSRTDDCQRELASSRKSAPQLVKTLVDSVSSDLASQCTLCSNASVRSGCSMSKEPRSNYGALPQGPLKLIVEKEATLSQSILRPLPALCAMLNGRRRNYREHSVTRKPLSGSSTSSSVRQACESLHCHSHYFASLYAAHYPQRALRVARSPLRNRTDLPRDADRRCSHQSLGMRVASRSARSFTNTRLSPHPACQR
jgi:hypothetical protein